MGWVQGVWVLELAPQRIQQGTPLVPGLVGVFLGWGMEIPGLRPTWASNLGVQVEEVAKSLEILELLAAEGIPIEGIALRGRVTEVHAGRVVSEERHL